MPSSTNPAEYAEVLEHRAAMHEQNAEKFRIEGLHTKAVRDPKIRENLAASTR